jgi:hypothetical protein
MCALTKLSLAAAAGLSSIVLGLVFASQAGATSFQQPSAPGIPSERDTIIVVRGVIQAGDHGRFIELLDRVNPDLVVMDGPAGFVEDALIMAEEIHSRGLKTLIGPHRACISACAIMFLSGRVKYLTRSSGLGLHASADGRGNPAPQADTLIAEHLKHFGVPSDILAKMNGTKSSDIWWLGASEQDPLSIQVIGLIDQIAPEPEALPSP